MACGALAGLAGFLYVGRFGTINVTAGSGLELAAIAAAVVGGVSTLGGSGTVMGAFLGAVLIGLLDQSLVRVPQISEFWRDAILGALILLARPARRQRRPPAPRARGRGIESGGRRWLAGPAGYTWELVLGVILLATIVFNLTQSTGYLGVDNFVNLFQLHIEKVIVVITMTFVIVAGEIDLSVASVMAWSASVLAALHEHDAPLALAIAAALAAAAVAGLINGWCVAKLGLPSLVVTLAGLIGWRGAARVLVEDRSIGDFPRWFDRLGQDDLVGPLPVAVVLFFVLFAVGWVILHRSATGRVLYVIGDNAEVARYSGVDVGRTRLRLFIASSLVAGVAGILFAARLGTVRGDMASGFELEIITIVLLGGVSIFGGSGRMSGVLLAVLIVLNLRNGFGLANVGGNAQTGVIGAILIGSVIAQNVIDRITDRSQGPRHCRPPSGRGRRAHEIS